MSSSPAYTANVLILKIEFIIVGTNISAKTDTVNGPITDDKTKSVTYADVERR